MAPAGGAGCPSVCPPARFIALAVSTGCRRQPLSSISPSFPQTQETSSDYRDPGECQTVTSRPGYPSLSVILPQVLFSERRANMEPRRTVLGLLLVSGPQYSGLRTSQGPSSVQMEVIWLRLCTDITNNYAMLGHTHSHIAAFPLSQAAPRSRNPAGDRGPKTWTKHSVRPSPCPASHAPA